MRELAPEQPEPGASSVEPRPVTRRAATKYLHECALLINAAQDKLRQGRIRECVAYQNRLHQNLLFLAYLADAQPSNEQNSHFKP